MDLKFYHGKIILHLIDHAMCLSQAVPVPSTHLRVMLDVFSPTGFLFVVDKFLNDNWNEFVNNELLALCEWFNIVVNSTAPQPPWSYGLVQRHNLILVDMLDKVLADRRCSFNVYHTVVYYSKEFSPRCP